MDGEPPSLGVKIIVAPDSVWPPSDTLPVTFRATFLGRPLQPAATKSRNISANVRKPTCDGPVAESITLGSEISVAPFKRSNPDGHENTRLRRHQNGRAVKIRQESIDNWPVAGS